MVNSTKTSSSTDDKSFIDSSIYLEISSMSARFLSLLWMSIRKSMELLGLAILVLNLSAPYFNIYSSGSNSSSNLTTLGLTSISFRILIALVVASSPALSPSKHNMILLAIFFNKAAFCFVRAVPMVATQLVIPIVFALITSINPSMTMIESFFLSISLALW